MLPLAEVKTELTASVLSTSRREGCFVPVPITASLLPFYSITTLSSALRS